LGRHAFLRHLQLPRNPLWIFQTIRRHVRDSFFCKSFKNLISYVSLPFSEALNKTWCSLFVPWPLSIWHQKAPENLRLSQWPAQNTTKLLCGMTENMETSLKLSKDENVKVIFYSMLPDFRISTALWKVPRFRSFVLVRTTCRWRWVWAIGGMIMMMTEKNLSTWRKNCRRTTSSNTYFTWTELG